MAENQPAPPSDAHSEGVDILRQSMAGASADVVDTNGRYNLAANGDSFDVVQLDDGMPVARFLIVEQEEAAVGVESRLETAGIETLEPAGLFDKKIFYSVPIGAKLLAHERFFPSRSSTETYVSDEELFVLLGSLWRDIYGAVGQLPAETPMKHTGMLEFSGHQTRFFPVPPYSWTPFEELHEAKEHFLTVVSEELLLPDAAAGDYERLVEAAGRAWEEE